MKTPLSVEGSKDFHEGGRVNPLFNYHRPRIGAWIEVTDEDAAGFLQSQFSNDLTAGMGQATYGLWLDHRGRIHGDSTVLQVDANHFYLHSHATDSESLRERLESHIVADDVVLMDRSSEVSGLIVWGEHTGEALAGTHLKLPDAARFAASETLWLFAAHAAPQGAWQIIGAPSAIEHLVEKFSSSGGGEMSAAAFDFARISACAPLVPVEVGPGETPLDAGLERACSWTKGCFLGQEVVARQHRLARRSNALAVVRVEGELPELPAAIVSPAGKVGTLRSVAREGDQQRGLAMMKARSLEPTNVPELWVEEGGAKVFVESAH